jgi:hypothetical protein
VVVCAVCLRLRSFYKARRFTQWYGSDLEDTVYSALCSFASKYPGRFERGLYVGAEDVPALKDVVKEMLRKPPDDESESALASRARNLVWFNILRDALGWKFQ